MPGPPSKQNRRRLRIILTFAFLPSVYLVHMASIHLSNARHGRVWNQLRDHARAGGILGGPTDNPGELFKFYDKSQWFTDQHGSGRHKVGYRDAQGAVVIPAEFRLALDFSEDLAFVVMSDRTRGYIRPDGALAFEADFEYAAEFSSGMAHVRTERDTGPFRSRLRSGYIDATGQTVVDPQYEAGSDFVGQFARVTKGTIYTPIYDRLMSGIDVDIGLGWFFPSQEIFLDNQGHRVSPKAVVRSMQP